MPELEAFLAEIDVQRSRRARELSDIKARFGQPRFADPFGIDSKAVVVLAYAHWEGFYNECVRTYLNLLRNLGCRVQDVAWTMLVGSLEPELQRLQDRNHSFTAKCDFVNALRAKLNSCFDDFNVSIVSARSNLDFERLSHNFQILNFNLSRFLSSRIRIDKELVGWRHAVAHGSAPNLQKADMADHIDFARRLLLTMSDQFQKEMLARFSRFTPA